MTPEINATDLGDIVDPHFRRAFETGSIPGMVYGVVRDTALVHTRGLGVISLESKPPKAPDADTVFSIASMTKSFTAAAVLSLRDSGQLELDHSVATYLPELARAGWIAEITLRHLLTMSGGFVTDDPWGDRQQALAAEAFGEILAGNLAPQWAPGRGFEYSNLGYAILGRVIEAVTRQAYPEVVRERVLDPVGMRDSGYRTDQLTGRTIATGYVRRGAEFAVEPIADCGAFAPMGGLLSTVYDVALWVSLMLSAESDGPTPEALPASLLREMQSGHRFVEAAAIVTDESVQPTLEVRHYGFGLMEERLSWGRSIAHSGGYPGYGSHMRWHPASGLGIVAMGNVTYARMASIATAALADVVQQLPASTAFAPLEAQLNRASELVTSLLNQWDDRLIEHGFASNVGQDKPWELRRSEAHRLRELHGELRLDESTTSVSHAPGHRIWWLVGEREGRVRCELLIGPEPGSPIQSMAWQSVADPSADVIEVAQSALAAVDPLAELGPREWEEKPHTLFHARTRSGEVEVRVDEDGIGGAKVRPTPVRVRPFDR